MKSGMVKTDPRKESVMRFDSGRFHGLFSNEGDHVGNTFRGIHHEERIVLAQGYGVKDSGVPLRFLAYAIPVLHLMRQLPEHAIIEFYIALHGALTANPEANAGKTIANAQTMALLLERYAKRVHPRIALRVRILTDTPLSTNPSVSTLLQTLVNTVREDCFADNQIRTFLEKRGGESALTYAVAHAIYMRDPLKGNDDPVVLMVPAMTLDAHHVVMVGGPAEKIFHKIRTIILKKVGAHSRWKSHQLFTPIGDPPTYHLQEGEPLWTDLQSMNGSAQALLYELARNHFDSKVREAVVHDLAFLMGDAGNATNFAELGKAAKGFLKGKPISPDLMSNLEAGWRVLHEL